MNDDIMRAAGFGSAVEAKHEGKCPFCGKLVDPMNEFRDEKSRREFQISGLCQKCQDEFFGI
jgi:hypothetical protein